MNWDRTLTRLLWSAAGMLAFMGIAVATRRAVVLVHPALTNAATPLLSWTRILRIIAG
jgi:hypothetical protein